MRRRAFLKNMGALCGRWLAAGGFSRLAISAASPAGRFRLGVISDELTQDFEEALKIMRGYGLRWVEIRTLWKTYNTEASPEQIRRLKSLLQQYEFTLSVLDTALYKCDLPGTKKCSGRKGCLPLLRPDGSAEARHGPGPRSWH